jgi:uncharacterized protein YbjT (DUF2867 family)
MFVVMGAAGHTGRVLAERLLEKGERVRVLGRSEEKLKALKDRGAEVMVGDAMDAAYLARAFQGADAAYTLMPPEPGASDFRAYQDRLGEATVKAIQASGLRRVAFLSSLGADLPAGTGPIAGLHAQEERLRNIPGVDVLSLRPGYFFENHFATLGLIKSQGINGGATAPDIPMVMIATKDIGEAAAQALLKPNFRGFTVRELLGPREMTMAECTTIIGKQIGIPDLQYVQFPVDAFVGSLVQAGLGHSLAQLYGEMTQAFNAGKIRSLEGRRPSNTTPTRFEDFAVTLGNAYRAT